MVMGNVGKVNVTANYIKEEEMWRGKLGGVVLSSPRAYAAWLLKYRPLRRLKECPTTFVVG